ncbi:MAG: hypothetical protein C5S47_00305 [Candidatus Methanogasteraceae archaeon]|nr:MAG: hypothetical protein C5S47_00305 [ANME-2 cluster archaeon]
MRAYETDSTMGNGDYIAGDDSGVVVIPKEQAYEIARRAKEVYKTELRIRAEIDLGKSLSEVLELAKWEMSQFRSEWRARNHRLEDSSVFRSSRIPALPFNPGYVTAPTRLHAPVWRCRPRRRSFWIAHRDRKY